jgi:ABC-type uncharacterized transport system ATPase component
LTQEGRQRFRKQKDALEDYVNSTVGALSEGDRRELARLLGLLADRTLGVLEEEGA